MDSTALLAGLEANRNLRNRLRAIHVDHGLHPDSHLWVENCRELTHQLHVPLTVRKAKIARGVGASLEAAARVARYALLREDLAKGEVLLTAHHEDDQLETVLLQLLRGAGLAGLAAMPPITPFAEGWLARPLLRMSRANLETWARKRSLKWVEDATNADERFDRNYLRRQVLPLIRQRWPGAAHATARTARHIAEGQLLLESLARTDVERASDGAALDAKILRALSPERRRNALRYWIVKAGSQVPDTRRLDEIAGPLLSARIDANPYVAWGGMILQRHADLLTLRKGQPPAAFHSVAWPVASQSVVELPGLGRLELVARARGPVDLDALPLELRIRMRRGGEKLRPRRDGPSRTIKKLLQEARVPPRDRDQTPLLFDGDRLLAVSDRWTDESIQASPSTKRRGRFVWHRYLSSS